LKRAFFIAVSNAPGPLLRAHLMLRKVFIIPVAAICASVAVGCGRNSAPHYVLSEAAQKLSPEIQKQIRDTLESNCGNFSSPKLLGDKQVSAATLKLGQEVYMLRCQQCHGTSGDGNGPAARYLAPRPRDYRKGIFKFTTTPYGAKPRREDLARTVMRGIPGTSMPSFRLLPKKELEAVVDYVLSLTHRGEVENALVVEGESAGELDPAEIPELIETLVRERWEESQHQEVQPLTAAPQMTHEAIEAGRKAFMSKGCSKCHGEDGRGQSRENVGTDAWGDPIKAADLTSGMLRGGNRPLDIYRRIISGINGTPMPGFSSVLAEEPETIWNLAAYVLYVSNERRRGRIPPAAAEVPAAVPEHK
jgi:mono/diheme cytochrome c family protein